MVQNMNTKMCFQFDCIGHHFDKDSVDNYQLQVANGFIVFIRIFFLLFGVVVVAVVIGGAIVVTMPRYVSHRSPVYNAGQSQYAIFPFIRHILPDKQYPGGQFPI